MLVRAVGISLLCEVARCFNAKFSAVNTALNVLDGLEEGNKVVPLQGK